MSNHGYRLYPTNRYREARKKWTDVADDNALLTVRRHVARGKGV